MNVPAAAQIPLSLLTNDIKISSIATTWEYFIKRLAKISGIDFPPLPPPQSVQKLVRGDVVALPLAGIIDFAAERARLEKERAKVATDIARIDAKLANPDFIARAPEDVVEGEREKRTEAQDRLAKISEALERLKDMAT